jgi:uncharacterized OB-fold protein
VSDARPLPEPDELSRAFWDAAREGRLVVQRCESCGRLQYPPDVACVHCGSTDVGPAEVSGRGTLWTYTVVDRLFHAGFADALPYVVALVELEEDAGVRLLTNVVDADPASLEIGMALEVTFEPRGDVALAQFRPARAPS